MAARAILTYGSTGTLTYHPTLCTKQIPYRGGQDDHTTADRRPKLGEGEPTGEPRLGRSLALPTDASSWTAWAHSAVPSVNLVII